MSLICISMVVKLLNSCSTRSLSNKTRSHVSLANCNLIGRQIPGDWGRGLTQKEHLSLLSFSGIRVVANRFVSLNIRPSELFCLYSDCPELPSIPQNTISLTVVFLVLFASRYERNTSLIVSTILLTKCSIKFFTGTSADESVTTTRFVGYGLNLVFCRHTR